MKILEAGHIYQLEWLDEAPGRVDAVAAVDGEIAENRLIFVNREQGTEHGGTQTQEVLRALIDRTQHCDGCLRWEGNDQIVHHLRMALVLHEARALERKTRKGILKPETIATSDDGHFLLQDKD